MMKIYQVPFNERADRIRFAHANFSPWLIKSVLDVGCDTAPLRQMLPGVRYFGIDIGGNPDKRIDLEKDQALPFESSSFHTVACFEVLEHLDCFHRIFAEFFRVAEANVIVSLPNCWCSARRPIERGSGAIAHYGLPLEPVCDRHKWFFSVSEIVAFFTSQSETLPHAVLESIIGVEKPRPAFVRGLRRLRHGQACYHNRYVHTVFARFSISKPRDSAI